MGLTDIPGGAAVGASLAIVFAAAFLLDRPNIVFRLLLFASIGVSAFSIYLSQVRSALVITGISLLALGLPMLRQRRPARFLVLVGAIVGIAVVAFLVAKDIGGEMVTKRFTSLVADDPETVYYTNRGIQVQSTLMELVPRYPLGAGLGRWGMMFAYFGDPYNPSSPPLWAELNWTGWVYDGGILLVLAYVGVLATLFVTGVRLSIRVDERPGRDLYKWATLHVAHAVGIISATFSAAPFSSTSGIDCLLLGAAVFAASQQLDAADRAPSTSG
jgi:energy-converting hydrogenase Eha subunit A